MLEQRGYQVRRVYGFSAVDQARCQIATNALSDGFEETMWIDADVGFHPDAVDQLRRHNLPIVAGIYAKKGVRSLAVHVFPGTKTINFGDKGGLLEVNYVGCGFLLVRRQVYETIKETLDLPMCNLSFAEKGLIPFFQPMTVLRNGSPWYLAEDFSFCERARMCEYKVMTDTRIRLLHFGSFGFSWEDAGASALRYRDYQFHLSQ